MTTRIYGVPLGHDGEPDCDRCLRLTNGVHVAEADLFRVARKSARRGAATADLASLRAERDMQRQRLADHIAEHAAGAR